MKSNKGTMAKLRNLPPGGSVLLTEYKSTRQVSAYFARLRVRYGMILRASSGPDGVRVTRDPLGGGDFSDLL